MNFSELSEMFECLPKSSLARQIGSYENINQEVYRQPELWPHLLFCLNIDTDEACSHMLCNSISLDTLLDPQMRDLIVTPLIQKVRGQQIKAMEVYSRLDQKHYLLNQK